MENKYTEKLFVWKTKIKEKGKAKIKKYDNCIGWTRDTHKERASKAIIELKRNNSKLHTTGFFGNLQLWHNYVLLTNQHGLKLWQSWICILHLYIYKSLAEITLFCFLKKR